MVVSAVCLLSLFAPEFFFTMSALFGYRYAGKEETPLYVAYVLIVFSATLLLYLASFWRKPRMPRGEIGLLLFICLMFINHTSWVIIDSARTPIIPENMIFFISMGITGFMVGRVVDAFSSWGELVKCAELIAWLMAIGIFMGVVVPTIKGEFNPGLSGSSNQTASYFSAITFGLLMVASIRSDNENRPVIVRNRLTALGRIALMMMLCAATLLNGGRGAFLLLLSYIVLGGYWFAFARGLTRRTLLRGIASLLVVPATVFGAGRIVSSNEFLSNGLTRAIGFIDFSGENIINWDGTAGRDDVYQAALNAIAEAPLLGYGVFGSWSGETSPHNIFLDLALQFGLPLSALLVIIFVFRLPGGRAIDKPVRRWILVVSLYPFVLLMFSGSYLRFSAFWFVIYVLFCVPRIRALPVGKSSWISSIKYGST
jgi:O-antigen ligase